MQKFETFFIVLDYKRNVFQILALTLLHILTFRKNEARDNLTPDCLVLPGN